MSDTEVADTVIVRDYCINTKYMNKQTKYKYKKIIQIIHKIRPYEDIELEIVFES